MGSIPTSSTNTNKDYNIETPYKIGNYYFVVNYVNGIHLSFVYSSARKANTDRNYIIKWLKDYVN